MQLTVLEPRIDFTPTSQYTPRDIIKGIEDFENETLSIFKLNLRPIYQRGEAWHQDFKECLVYSIITNYPIGTFVFRKLDKDIQRSATHEVVDGQQRLLAIHSFVKGDFALSAELSNKILLENEANFSFDIERGFISNSTKIYKKYLNQGSINTKMKFSDLPTTLQERILNFKLNVIEINKCTDETIEQYFRLIQNQERLRAGEIINSIPLSGLTKYLDKINDRQKFLDKINWNESRKEFEKIFYSMAGIFDNKLNFGTTDNKIIEYVAKFEKMSEKAEERFLTMIKHINLVTESNVINEGKFSKRLIKFFFLSSGFEIIDYSIDTDLKFKTLLKIESKFPSFNSGKQENIDKEFVGYEQGIVDLYNELFILGRGSHSPSSTERIIKKLKLIFDYEILKL